MDKLQQSTGVCKNISVPPTSSFGGGVGKRKIQSSVKEGKWKPTVYHSGFQILLVFPSLHSAPCNHVSYQGIDIFHFHGPTVENVSAQDNKEEEKAQQHVAHIAEDVVESTAGKTIEDKGSTAEGG